MRLAVDTGGTFTDLVVDDGGATSLYKSPTTPDDPVDGVVDALTLAAADRGVPLAGLLGEADDLIFGTTRAINAILTRTTSRTALLVTEGHRDVLYLREGGRRRPFDHTRAYPEPFIPRSLTFEVPERITATGEVIRELDIARVRDVARRLGQLEVEAVGVCLLWSVIDDRHERQVEAILSDELPGVPVTLSSALNPTIREFRRASSTAIDAALKPIMSDHLSALDDRLRYHGFTGELYVVTSSGGLMPSQEVAAAPILAINSGPAMAPVAGRHYAGRAAADPGRPVIVADTGGTTFDVSVVDRGEISRTRESWIGEPYHGLLTGFPSVDITSIGSGGGSIAWVDEGGLLRLGPDSAGSQPGPAAYGRGGTRPTVTDASIVAGIIDPDNFLGGRMRLDPSAAAAALTAEVGAPLGLDVRDAAEAVLRLAMEQMVGAIEAITVHQGVDPRDAVIVGGGGAAGLNAVGIARRLGCDTVVLPDVGATLSAAGALLSDLSVEHVMTAPMRSDRFDARRATEVVRGLEARCEAFERRVGVETQRRLLVEARYPSQVWELEVGLPALEVSESGAAETIARAFHVAHERVFAVTDEASPVEIVAWRMQSTSSAGRNLAPVRSAAGGGEEAARMVRFVGIGDRLAKIVGRDLVRGTVLHGPVVLESPVTTIVVDPGATVEIGDSGAVVVRVTEQAESMAGAAEAP